jgi:hypothetical protein
MVNLPYTSWNEIRGLSVGGKATAVTDPEEMDRVSKMMLRKFPRIAVRANGHGAISVVPDHLEMISVFDYRKGLGTPISSRSSLKGIGPRRA